MENAWAYTVMATAAPIAFSAVSPIVKGEEVNARQIRRAYALAGIFALGTGVAVAILMRRPDPILVGAAVLTANAAAQEWALALRSVERQRPE